MEARGTSSPRPVSDILHQDLPTTVADLVTRVAAMEEKLQAEEAAAAKPSDPRAIVGGSFAGKGTPIYTHTASYVVQIEKRTDSPAFTSRTQLEIEDFICRELLSFEKVKVRQDHLSSHTKQE